VKPEEIAPLLGRTELFGRLSDKARLELAAHMIERLIPRGDVIFHKGDFGDCLYVVAKGLVKVFMTSPEGIEMVLATLKPPTTFGELALIDEGPRSASARAIEPTILIALRRVAFLEILKAEPAVVDALHRALGALLRRVLEQASDLIFLDLPGRVAKLLMALAEDLGQHTEEGILLDMQLSQSTLAGMVGGSRPSINQILRDFDARGYVALQGRHVLIRRPDELRRRASM
jgi:CRP-like cAMP-binding protein